MRTMLQERHRPFFENLQGEEIPLVFDRVTRYWPGDMKGISLDHPPHTSGELFDLCQRAGLDHARVIFALAREFDGPGRRAIEALIGKAIAPWSETVEAAAVQTSPQPAKQLAPSALPDARVILAVAGNCPHREGTTAYAEFHRWRVGATIGQIMQEGQSRRALRRALRNNWLTLSPGQGGEDDGGEDEE